MPCLDKKENDMELFAILVFVCYAALIVGCLAATIHGLVLAFRASIVLGIICFFISPAYLIFGLVKWFAGVDLAQLIVERFKEV